MDIKHFPNEKFSIEISSKIAKCGRKIHRYRSYDNSNAPERVYFRQSLL